MRSVLPLVRSLEAGMDLEMPLRLLRARTLPKALESGRLSRETVLTSARRILVCILGVTQQGAPMQFAGLAIGLTLVAIHIVGINVTGVSVNPARSLGPAIVGMGAKPAALGQVWLFIIAPLIGAGIAGFLFKSGGILSADNA